MIVYCLFFCLVAVTVLHGRDVDQWLRQVKSPHAFLRETAVKHLGDVGTRQSWTAVISALGDKEELVRLAAVRVLRNTKDKPADRSPVRFLVEALGDPSPRVRRTALWSLQCMGWSPSTKRQEVFSLIARQQWRKVVDSGATAVVPLQALLHAPTAQPQGEFIWCLGQLKAGSARQAVTDAVGDPRLQVRYEAIRAVERIAGPDAPQLLKNACSDPDPVIKRRLVETAGRLYAHGGKELLLTLMNDQHPFIRQEAAATLDAYDWQPSGDTQKASWLIHKKDWTGLENMGKAALPVVLKCMDHPDEEVRRRLTKMLKKHGGPEIVEPLLELVEGEEYEVREETVALLARLKAPRIPAILLRLAAHKDRFVRSAAIIALANRKHPRARALLLEAIADPKSASHWSLIAALGAFYNKKTQKEDVEVVEFLVQLLNDDINNFNSSSEVLKKINTPYADFLLIRALDDAAPKIRATAAEILGHHARPEAFLPLTALMEDEAESVRRAALRALQGFKSPRLVPLLLPLLGTDYKKVEPEVFYLLGDIKDPRAVEPLCRLIQFGDFRIKGYAAKALIKINHPSTVSFLEPLIRPDGTSAHQEALRVLENLESGKKWIQKKLLKDLASLRPGLRSSAARSLGRFPGAEVISPLIRALNDPDNEVVENAASSLKTIFCHLYPGEQCSRIDKSSRQHMRGLVKRLAGKNEERILTAALKKYTGKDDYNIRMATVLYLGALCSTRATPLLLANVDTDPDMSVRKAAVKALGMIADTRALEKLTALLKDTYSGLRLPAVRALTKSGGPCVIKTFHDVLKDNTTYHPDEARLQFRTRHMPENLESYLWELKRERIDLKKEIKKVLEKMEKDSSVESVQ